MSRTDAHRPLWVVIDDHPELTRELHDHTDGTCDLDGVPVGRRGRLAQERPVPVGGHSVVGRCQTARMLDLRIVTGDATRPQVEGAKIVAHVCNDTGGWGKGFVLAVSKRWPEPERQYRAWHRDRHHNDFGLGAVQLVRVEAELHVANMVGQHGLRPTSDGPPPVRYAAIAECLDTLGDHALRLGASIHLPRIGCGLAGGRWEQVEPLITTSLCARDLAVTVYDVG